MIPILFFDGGYPLCRREIAHYRQTDGSGKGQKGPTMAASWVDQSKSGQDWGEASAKAMEGTAGGC